ncbi:MAG: DNA repair protein RadA [Elusimicrobia bacterium]|nr:DNA repair protein RadA [Elusimicrobiota bacterium]
MVRLKTIYRCQECGQASAKWIGQCPACSQWNTFVEEAEEALSRTTSKSRALTEFTSEPVKLSDSESIEPKYMSTGIAEFDRVLGGGIIEGQVILLAGPPGIGKSTIMLEVSKAMASGPLKSGKILYVSGEESLAQVGSRARRLGAKAENVYLLSETNLAKVIDVFNKIKPGLLIIDSIQTAFHPEFTGSPGSVGQIRECASELLKIAKSKGAPLFLLGHVTKEGALAGPKVLEHIVDTVLYFDSEKNDVYRILRPNKNRFGPVNEIGLFEMTEKGLVSVTDSSGILANTDRSRPLIGRAFSIAFEGSRPMLAEIQALASRSYYPYPRRTVAGLDLNRAQLLIAAVEKNTGLRFDTMDVFASLQGGIKLKDPALDLAFCAALISSARDLELAPDTVFLGEVGILAQTSPAAFMARRLSEAEQLGFKKAFTPRLNLKKETLKLTELAVEPVADIAGLYAALAKGRV